MTTATRDWTLTPEQLAQLWDRTGLDVLPYPVQVRRHGLTEAEAAVAGGKVRAGLRALGLLDRHGRPSPDLESALRLLAAPEAAVDSVWLDARGAGSPYRALAARTGRRAVLALQAPGPDQLTGGPITLRDIGVSALVDAVVRGIPPAPPGRRPGGRWPADRAEQARPFTDLVHAPRTRAGQFGVRVDRARGPVLSWFDVPGDGRYALVRTPRPGGAGWVAVHPADAPTLCRGLIDILDRTARG
ncbi:ESX secretion-associated protein EspG [Actinokineospora sp. PR83]|uniref:ESX secretion-associated protein EspG n=1 Tax=Actinokineospora sp. PR83 TaxID=2884908 RepID=UPI0027E06F73|nr:ESX secretion-associated protein EspG [Actinokineospora sp. PR83]MCG8920516.1 ESX secretion-associated protein EspG [Actinokineospora sp. PR83]